MGVWEYGSVGVWEYGSALPTDLTAEVIAKAVAQRRCVIV
jgi:hypothetical protein